MSTSSSVTRKYSLRRLLIAKFIAAGVEQRSKAGAMDMPSAKHANHLIFRVFESRSGIRAGKTYLMRAKISACSKSSLVGIKKEHSKNALKENMANNKKGQNFSTWIVVVGLTVIAPAGCAG
jgi:hypothetical protein